MNVEVDRDIHSLGWESPGSFKGTLSDDKEKSYLS